MVGVGHSLVGLTPPPYLTHIDGLAAPPMCNGESDSSAFVAFRHPPWFALLCLACPGGRRDCVARCPSQLEQAATRIQTAYRGYLASSARSVHDLGLMQEAKWATEALSGHGTQETDLPSGMPQSS